LPGRLVGLRSSREPRRLGSSSIGRERVGAGDERVRRRNLGGSILRFVL
jgi:hypothetical protein